MNRDDIIRMSREAGWSRIYTQWAEPTGKPDWSTVKESLTVPVTMEQIERFADLVASAERNKLAAWMIQFGFATGHGDTMEQLVDALGSEIVERIKFEIDTEREVCAQMADDVVAGKSWFNDLPADIRTRSNDAP